METVATEKVGSLTLVRLSSFLVPESSSSFKSKVILVTSIAVKSTVKFRAPDSPHWFPAKSVKRA